MVVFLLKERITYKYFSRWRKKLPFPLQASVKTNNYSSSARGKNVCDKLHGCYVLSLPGRFDPCVEIFFFQYIINFPYVFEGTC